MLMLPFDVGCRKFIVLYLNYLLPLIILYLHYFMHALFFSRDSFFSTFFANCMNLLTTKYSYLYYCKITDRWLLCCTKIVGSYIQKEVFSYIFN